MTVTLTEKAAFRLRSFLRAGSAETPEIITKGVRIAVLTGGCSGYEYALNVVNQPNSNDLVYEQDKVPLYIDPQSASLLDGVVVDFVDSLLQSGFTFTNPNATSTCGCGKSFQAGDCTPEGVSCS